MRRSSSRIVWAVTVLVAAFLLAPVAAVPGINSADLIVMCLPFGFVWAVLPWLVKTDG